MNRYCFGMLLGLAAGGLFLSGCGGAGTEGRQTVYPVSGTVTMSGGPLTGASVSFAPREGQPVAVGRTDDSGKFVLTTYEGTDGAAEGEFAVVISKASPTAQSGQVSSDAHSTDPYAQPTGSHSASSQSSGGGGGVPEQYTNSKTTPLSATVDPEGDNTFDFEL